jgi:hypothetical protein
MNFSFDQYDELDELGDESVDVCEVAPALNGEEIRDMARLHIEKYFEDKSILEGLDIFSPKYIDFCVGMDICRAVDKAYDCMAKSGKFDTSSSEHMISQDIRHVIRTLGDIRRIVPQDFSAGMLLVHLELIDGVLID